MSDAPEPVQGLLVAHGTFSAGMLDAVRRITGIEGALTPVSNSGLGPDALAQAILERLEAGPAILFTDLKSGSCGMAAHRLLRERGELSVVSGVNLPLLLDFVMHRNMPLSELVTRLVEKGRAAIGCAPEELVDADRPAARG
jgi:mannose/fructose-specific phosphotransferase system component IIA